MINHMRTLFINDRYKKSYEYVDPDFRSVIVPADVERAHRLLLPDDLNDIQLNALTDNYILSLHQGEYGNRMYDFDTRITYATTMETVVPPEDLPVHSSTPKLFVDKLPEYVFEKFPDFRSQYYSVNPFYDRFSAAMLAMLNYMENIRLGGLV